MYNARNIVKSFEGAKILNGASLSLAPGERVALVGSNGAGKTALLRILASLDSADEGAVTGDGKGVGYVPQDLEPSDGPAGDLFGTNGEEWRVRAAATSCGLREGDLLKKPQELSGGQRTRLALALVLAQDPAPGVLLLDEPTNNLDASGLAWLSEFLRSFRGAVMFSSHDRAFVNRTASSILELTNGTLRKYGGNYDGYCLSKEAEREAERSAYLVYDKERNRLKRLAAQAKAKAKASRASSGALPRDNDKFIPNFKREAVQNVFGAKAKSFESRLEKLETVSSPSGPADRSVRLGGNSNPGKLVLRFESVRRWRKKDMVVSDVDFELRGAERVRVTGPNGSGKSTILMLAAGDLEPDSGRVIIGDSVRRGYFSQEAAGLIMDQRSLNSLLKATADRERAFFQARRMGFAPSDLELLPGRLSRGQQAKLAFCALLLAEHDVLILDEPTNHLDIETREAIESALSEYQGALLVATHDEYFAETIGFQRAMALGRTG